MTDRAPMLPDPALASTARASGGLASGAHLPNKSAPASSEIGCPHCGARSTHPGKTTIVDCATCGRSFATPQARSLRRAAASAARATFESIQARSPADVGLGRTGALAVVVTVVFYLSVVNPLAGTYFGDLLGARGSVQYVIIWMSAWAGLLLARKASLLRAQRPVLELDLLPDDIGLRITPQNTASFRAHLRTLPEREVAQPRLLGGGAVRSFLILRVERALEHFQIRGRAAEVTEQLANQSQLDGNAVESSYTMVRVLIWAIPLLGFIGTVLGISEAVTAFSDSVAAAIDIDVMKQSIGSVTIGLGVAFDTTLLALVMSIAVMFPTSALQKAEEDFLDRIDSYCEQRLARRLDDSRPPGAHAANADASTPAVADGDTDRGTDRGTDPGIVPGADEASRAGTAAIGAFAATTDSASQGLADLEKQVARLAETLGALDARFRQSAPDDEDGV